MCGKRRECWWLRDAGHDRDKAFGGADSSFRKRTHGLHGLGADSSLHVAAVRRNDQQRLCQSDNHARSAL